LHTLSSGGAIYEQGCWIARVRALVVGILPGIPQKAGRGVAAAGSGDTIARFPSWPHIRWALKLAANGCWKDLLTDSSQSIAVLPFLRALRPATKAARFRRHRRDYEAVTGLGHTSRLYLTSEGRGSRISD